MIQLALIHAAAVAVIACLISESIIAEPVRRALSWFLHQFGFKCTVLYCPICLGFWIAAPTLLCGWLHYFLVVAMSNVWMLVILKVYELLDSSSESN